MSTHHNGNGSYSLETLSRILKVNIKEAAQVAQKLGLQEEGIHANSYLMQHTLERFFEEFRRSRGIPELFYELPRWLQADPGPWATTLRELYQQKFTFPIALSPTQGSLLRALVSNTAPKTIVEIGCFTGISALWLAAGLEDASCEGIVHTIDVFGEKLPYPPYHYAYIDDSLHVAQQAVRKAQLSHRIIFHQQDSKEVSTIIHQILNDPIDFLFIDGDHTVQGCLDDFMRFYPHVAVGGYIVLHDIYPESCNWPGPRYVIDKYIKSSPSFEVIEVKTHPLNYGIALIRKLAVDEAIMEVRASQGFDSSFTVSEAIK